MRICHVMSGDLWAGAEVMNLHLLRGLKRIHGVELHAIVLNEGRLSGELRKEGVPVHILDESSCGFFSLAKKAGKVMSGIAPDLVHSHRVKENILAYLATRDGRAVSLLCTQHGMPEPAASVSKRVKKAIVGKLHRSILARHFRCVVAVSGEMKQQLMREFDLPEEKVACIPNGIEIPPDAVRCGSGPEGFAIGSAGRFFPVKDYALMAAVAREVSKGNPGVVFRLAGDGPERDDILRRIRDYGLEETFRLVGFVEDMDGFYRGLDLYISTSIHEGTPMSVLEAMARGIPVVAPDCGGFSEIVTDGEQGFLVRGRDPAMFAARCLRLIDDRRLLERMGAAARERVRERYSTSGMAGKYHDLYRRILG